MARKMNMTGEGMMRVQIILLSAISLVSGVAAQDPVRDLVGELPVAVRYHTVGGHRVAYYEAGPPGAPVVMLIPTLRWDAHSWAQNVPALSLSHRVIAIDPLGTGRSDKPRIDFKMSTWTDSFADFLREKGIDRAVFVGTEMGGALAVQMALDHPQYVRAIVVAASNSGPGARDGGARRVGGGLTAEGTRAGLLQEFFDPALITDAVVQTVLNRRLKADDRHTIQSHLSDHRPPYSPEELARIRVPALFVWCREDRITPPAWGRDFAAAVPAAELRVLEGCGHYPNLEQPGLFNAAVAGFLRTLDARRAPQVMPVPGR